MNKFNQQEQEKRPGMAQNAIDDSELDQVNGGGKLWDFVTTEFKEFFEDLRKRDYPPEGTEVNGIFGVNTLEMRSNPMQEQENMEPPKVLKL